ncbi:MAG TPA: polysaccharide biosynthesis protein [Terracidiphilus sp.]|nr:polysaccharide biosynthesis protein [Terracidiphilus sp.]
MTASLETIDWYSFLARPQLPFPPPATLDKLRGSRILITGAGGSIGTALALRIATLEPKILVLLEASEGNLFALQNAFAKNAPQSHTVFVLGDISDRSLIDELFALHAPELIFHAAAFKHVPLLEEHPLAAIANNVFGTRSLACATAAHNAHLVLLSTDKAAAPASIMGTTKRVAEQIVLAAHGTVLRLGNVLASRDSVAELFAADLGAHRPLTVTNPAARRFFVTMDEAVGLLLAAALAGPALFAAALQQSHYIADFARFLSRALAPTEPVAIEFSHLRNGDKEAEQLWSSAETPHEAQPNGLIPISSPQPRKLNDTLDTLHAALHARDLSTALVLIAQLVPDFTPSAALCTLADSRASQAAQ